VRADDEGGEQACHGRESAVGQVEHAREAVVAVTVLEQKGDPRHQQGRNAELAEQGQDARHATFAAKPEANRDAACDAEAGRRQVPDRSRIPSVHVSPFGRGMRCLDRTGGRLKKR
jgi:hypothetical protein